MIVVVSSQERVKRIECFYWMREQKVEESVTQLTSFWCEGVGSILPSQARLSSFSAATPTLCKNHQRYRVFYFTQTSYDTQAVYLYSKFWFILMLQDSVCRMMSKIRSFSRTARDGVETSGGRSFDEIINPMLLHNCRLNKTCRWLRKTMLHWISPNNKTIDTSWVISKSNDRIYAVQWVS